MMRLPIIRVPLPSHFHYGWVIVGSALIMNVAAAPLHPITFSFFLSPMSEDLGWSRGALSLALTFRFATIGATGFLIGSVLDRFGPRWLGALAGVVAGGSLIGLFFTHEIWLLYLLFAASGAVGLGGGGGSNLITSVAVAKWFVAKRGRAMAIAGAGLAGGTAVSIPLAQFLIQTIGWREAWVVLGVGLGAIVIPLSILFMRRPPGDLAPPDGVTGVPYRGGGERAVSTEATESDWTVGEALRTPALWLILSAVAMIGFVLAGTMVHRVAYWEEVGMSPALVAIGTAMDPITVVFSALAFGVAGEMVRTRYLGLVAGSVYALSMLPLILTTGQAYTIFTHGIVWGTAAGAFMAINNLIWPGYFGRRFLGSIRGVVLPVALAAAALGPPIYGYLIDSGVASTTLWTISLGLFAFAGVLMFLAKPPKRRAR